MGNIKKIILGVFGGIAIVFVIAILLFLVWIAAYVALAFSVFILGYFLVTQYIEYKSDVVKKMDTK